MAEMTAETGSVSYSPVPTGLRRPFSSGSPRVMVSTLMAVALPFSPRISTGAHRKRNFTPSASASADFFVRCGHLLAADGGRAACSVRTAARGGARDVDGDIAAAEHGDLLADGRALAEVHGAQEL